MAEIEPVPLIRSVIDDVLDRRRMSRGIAACEQRRSDFSSTLEMQLAGIAMVPEARQQMNDTLTDYWEARDLRFPDDLSGREVLIGAGFHAATWAAARVLAGFPRPVVLEQGNGSQVGGAFAVSLNPVFRLNSRARPGRPGLPDQDRALNYLPGALLQPSMISSEEYPDNADMAWIIRLTLAQYADVFTGVTVERIAASTGSLMSVTTSSGTIEGCRVIDARGVSQPAPGKNPDAPTFMELMARMGGMFPLRGMQQVAVIGSGNSAQCAVESLLGMAPGNTSALGLDYVTRVDWYTGGKVASLTCEQYRQAQRGRYVRIAQYLKGNVSNPSTRLRLMGDRGYATPVPGGVLVNDRTYDMAVLCTGSKLEPLGGTVLSYYPLRANGTGTVVARSADPFPLYRIGPAADLDFSNAEAQAGITANPPSKVAIFRLAARTAALAAMLPAVGE